MNKIEIQHLKKQYHNQAVLDDVSFNVKAGQVVALLGGSGVGKSTLLRCLNLMEQPQAGAIKWGSEISVDFDIHSKLSAAMLRKLRTKVGMVFQQFHLWSHMTVLENLIEAPVRVLKQSETQAVADAEALLEQLGLVDKGNCYPRQLSGGQQQRVAIARALMMQPEVILFDEPTSSLDPTAVQGLIKIVKTLKAKGMTMIIATHELGFAKAVADEIVFLDAGKVLEQGTTQQLFLQPKTQKLQNFIGDVAS